MVGVQEISSCKCNTRVVLGPPTINVYEQYLSFCQRGKTRRVPRVPPDMHFCTLHTVNIIFNIQVYWIVELSFILSLPPPLSPLPFPPFTLSPHYLSSLSPHYLCPPFLLLSPLSFSFSLLPSPDLSSSPLSHVVGMVILKPT